MQDSDVKYLAVKALEDVKADDIRCLDVRRQTEITDYMIVASGTSHRHVKALVGQVLNEAAKAGLRPLGVEGIESGEWVLIDFIDVVVHVMLPQTRSFYDIEKFWSLNLIHHGENTLIEY